MSQIPICSGSWSELQPTSYPDPVPKHKGVSRRPQAVPGAGSDTQPICKDAARSGGERPAWAVTAGAAGVAPRSGSGG